MGPAGDSRYTGWVATLPTTHTVVSFMRNPSLTPVDRAGDGTRTGPSRTAASDAAVMPCGLPPPV
ncbi:hypothetical protein GCM10010448_62740 [Streptomyces glomeratus]|uniref:Uncharacterized protein n=1 Tax=Streptomyces glomeratus TaxID=284452 RepID=A0ABP6M0Z3_9ACTN